MSDSKAQDRPSTPRLEYTAAQPDVTLIRDLLAGTRRMHDRFKEYIRKYPAEKPERFKIRATSAKVYGGLARVLSASVGMLFAKPPKQLDGWSPEMKQHWENIDGKGTHGDVFTKRRAEDSTADGFCGILVDFPSAPKDVIVHSGNEAALNLRPFWAPYARADILSWRSMVLNNVDTLVQVVLREGATTNVGQFGTSFVLLYRVCKLVFQVDPQRPDMPADLMAVWQLLEEVKDGGTVTVTQRAAGVFRDNKGTPFKQIPLAIAYAGRTDAHLCAQPPLLDVAWANLEHWRKATNLSYYEDLCCFPQPTVNGELAKGPNGETIPFQTGPGVLVQTEKDGKFGWTEVTGTSLQALREALSVLKDEISELGMSFLSKRSRGVETAEAKRLDSTAENSTLATAAQGIEDGHNQALMFHAQYLGIDANSAPTIQINRDFDNISIDPQVMAVYVAAVKDAGLPPRILLEAWQQGGRIPADVDLDALEAEMLANAEAQRAQAEADAAAKAKQNQPPAAA